MVKQKTAMHATQNSFFNSQHTERERERVTEKSSVVEVLGIHENNFKRPIRHVWIGEDDWNFTENWEKKKSSTELRARDLDWWVYIGKEFTRKCICLLWLLWLHLIKRRLDFLPSPVSEWIGFTCGTGLFHFRFTRCCFLPKEQGHSPQDKVYC